MVHFIAITGGSGSGKSWLAARLKRRLGAGAGILRLDDFYRDLSALPMAERKECNFDDPAAIDWEGFIACLRALQNGKKIHLPRYDFATHTRLKRNRLWKPRPIVIIEGLWLFHRRELLNLWSLGIYVECDEATRLQRRVQRDQQERGRSRASIVRQFQRQVSPMHERFVAPQAKLANLAIGPVISRVALSELAAKVIALARRVRPL